MLDLQTLARSLGVPATELQLGVGTVECEARDDATPVLTGYAAVFGVETVIAGLFRERIDPGAFDRAIRRDDVRALVNHSEDYVLGRTTAGTLRLSVDAVGLRYEVDPPDTQWARDLLVTIKRRDVRESSFAFRVRKEAFEEPPARGELPLRIIRDVELFDVSPVTYPAYPQTSVSARAAAATLAETVARSTGSPARWRVRITETNH